MLEKVIRMNFLLKTILIKLVEGANLYFLPILLDDKMGQAITGCDKRA